VLCCDGVVWGQYDDESDEDSIDVSRGINRKANNSIQLQAIERSNNSQLNFHGSLPVARSGSGSMSSGSESGSDNGSQSPRIRTENPIRSPARPHRQQQQQLKAKYNPPAGEDVEL
jgi:hypothetical protein